MGKEVFNRCIVSEIGMDEMVAGEGMGLGDWVWRRESGKVIRASVSLLVSRGNSAGLFTWYACWYWRLGVME